MAFRCNFPLKQGFLSTNLSFSLFLDFRALSDTVYFLRFDSHCLLSLNRCDCLNDKTRNTEKKNYRSKFCWFLYAGAEGEERTDLRNVLFPCEEVKGMESFFNTFNRYQTYKKYHEEASYVLTGISASPHPNFG